MQQGLEVKGGGIRGVGSPGGGQQAVSCVLFVATVGRRILLERRCERVSSKGDRVVEGEGMVPHGFDGIRWLQ